MSETGHTANWLQATLDPRNDHSWARRCGPGIALAAAITVIAILLATLEKAIIGYEVLEPLVLGLILGIAIRSIWGVPAIFLPGIAFAAKQILEFAIVLLGASLDLHQLAHAGSKILLAVLISVCVTLVTGITIGRAAGLGTRLAILVAVGNAICGNSAIAAVAPAIRAKKEEVASAIALTAVFGVGVVLTLPLLIPVFDLSNERYGVIAGLTVYAVPQVLAATFPVSAESGQIGSLVKLTRVLLLGPVVAFFAWWTARNEGRGERREERDAGIGAAASAPRSSRLSSLFSYLPWFVIGFVLLAILRTVNVIPDSTGVSVQNVSKILTAVAMTALGLTVDVKSVRKGGAKVALTVSALTVLLVGMSLLLVTVLGIG
ncbi:MAG: putative sulfate exporter family transporter [Thermomicrobiales bacterium]